MSGNDLESKLLALCGTTYSDVGMYPHPMLGFARAAAQLALDHAADLLESDCECDVCMGVMPERFECPLVEAASAIRAIKLGL